MKTDNTYLNWVDFLTVFIETIPSSLFIYKWGVVLSFTKEQSIFLSISFGVLLFILLLLSSKVSNYIADKNATHIAWNSVEDKSIVLPSKSSKILVTDGKNVNAISVAAFLENVDKPYNNWTHWSEINYIK